MSVRVGAILKSKGSAVVTIPPDATVADAVAALAQHNVGALVVSSNGRQVEGIVSERDLVRHLARRGAETLRVEVRDVMSADVTTCTRADTGDELMAVMTNQRMRHLPVVEAGVLVGIVSIGDVVKARIDDLETQAESLQEYVTGSSY